MDVGLGVKGGQQSENEWKDGSTIWKENEMQESQRAMVINNESSI